MVSTLPKSVVIEGRRLPTWTLSHEARQQLINIRQVDAHIAELKARLTYYAEARRCCQRSLLEKLPEAPKGNFPSYYWQIVSLECGSQVLADGSRQVALDRLAAGEPYVEGDCLLIYVKGKGLCGWGEVKRVGGSDECFLIWRDKVAFLRDCLSAKSLKAYGLRHPTRASQRLPENTDVLPLFEALAECGA